MIQKFLAREAAKKTTVFIVVFAMTFAAMSGILNLAEPGYEIAASPSSQEEILYQVEDQAIPAAAPVSGIVLEMKRPAMTPPLPERTLLSGEAPALGEEPVFGRSGVSERAEEEPEAGEEDLSADGFVYTAGIPLSYDLQRYTYDICADKGLEYELILALMWRESGFQTDAVGHNTNGTKDSGIMQINDVNRGWLREQYGIEDLMDPIQNINAGTTILSLFTEKYGQHGALMAYQYGETGMKRQYARGVYTNDKIALLMNKRDEFSLLLQNA